MANPRNSSREEHVKSIVKDEFSEPVIGRVSKVYPHKDGNDGYLHECNVEVIGKERELRHVQVAKNSTTEIYVPRKDDLVVVSFVGRDELPIVSNVLNSGIIKEDIKANDVSGEKYYRPIPALYGDYKMRLWEEAEIEITRDITPQNDEGRTDIERSSDDVQINIGKRTDSLGEYDMGFQMDIGKDEITIHDDEGKAHIKMYNNDSNEKVVEILNDETEDSGMRINMETGEFQIGNGDYGIESDGQGNFDWYFNSLSMHESDGQTLSW